MSHFITFFALVAVNKCRSIKGKGGFEAGDRIPSQSLCWNVPHSQVAVFTPLTTFHIMGSVLCTGAQGVLFSDSFPGGKLASGVPAASPVGLACRPEMSSAPRYAPGRWMKQWSWPMTCVASTSPAPCKLVTASTVPQPGIPRNGSRWVLSIGVCVCIRDSGQGVMLFELFCSFKGMFKVSSSFPLWVLPRSYSIPALLITYHVLSSVLHHVIPKSNSKEPWSK